MVSSFLSFESKYWRKYDGLFFKTNPPHDAKAFPGRSQIMLNFQDPEQNLQMLVSCRRDAAASAIT